MEGNELMTDDKPTNTGQHVGIILEKHAPTLNMLLRH
jgi:hypothetical protein